MQKGSDHKKPSVKDVRDVVLFRKKTQIMMGNSRICMFLTNEMKKYEIIILKIEVVGHSTNFVLISRSIFMKKIDEIWEKSGLKINWTSKCELIRYIKISYSFLFSKYNLKILKLVFMHICIHVKTKTISLLFWI